MDVELEYDGWVPSDQSGDAHSDIKQLLRRAFSEQLRRHWTQQSEVLWPWYQRGLPHAAVGAEGRFSCDPTMPFFRVQTLGFWAIPLASYHNGLRCQVGVKILRRQRRGMPPQRVDLDNQLKLVNDALKMPIRSGEVPGNMWGNGEELFVLVEDDSLITRASVEGVPRLDYNGPSPASDDPKDPVKLRVTATIAPFDVRHPALVAFV